VLKGHGIGLFGAHASVLDDTNALNLRRCVLFNADMVYLRLFDADALPAAAQEVACRFHEEVLGAAISAAAAVPVHLVVTALRGLFQQLLAPCLEPTGALEPFQGAAAGGKPAAVVATALDEGGPRGDAVRAVLDGMRDSLVPAVPKMQWSAALAAEGAPRVRVEAQFGGGPKTKERGRKNTTAKWADKK
jgi:hypothetical protein